MTFVTDFQKQPHPRIFAEAAALLIPIAILDYSTGYEVSLSILYCVPIFLVAWCCDRKSGLLMALMAGLTWWWADIQGGHPYLQSWMEAWEVFVRCGFFIITAIGTSGVRNQRDASASRIALLEYSQRLERELIGASEREQERIGQDLHDGICQYLAALSCNAASLKSDLERQNLTAEASAADELATYLSEAVVQTRNLARGLVPVQMDEAGLSSALEELTASVTHLLGVRCTYHSAGVPLIRDKMVAMHLYRIAQEAINNATKHGRARSIRVSLTEDGKASTLRIADDGVGISKTRTDDGMGLGLMYYRSRLVGGELRIEEPPAGGTVVSCGVPLAAEKEMKYAA
ncbi:MAG: sensor histidine kinase [Chthoniobacterales bacterium]|nr:MAG: sensor histidine kinase [Chthoniobacterales bacterium]